MTFNDKLQEFRTSTSQAAMAKVISDAELKAKKKLQLDSLIGKLNPLVEPLLKKFSEDANKEQYFSSYDFHKEEGNRCWWRCSFVPALNEEPYRGPFAGSHNQASALVRLHYDGDLRLEWHLPGSGASHEFMQSQLNRVVNVEDLTSEKLQVWLDEFTFDMLAYRKKRDQT